MLVDKIQLEADETVLIQVRKHWFILFAQWLSILFASLTPIILGGVLLFFSEASYIEQVWDTYRAEFLFLYVCWLVLAWMAAFNVWTNYYLDVWTVTNRRLIAVDQKGLFRRHVGSFRLERLQDMNMEVEGILPTFLDYGTLEAQTAAGSEEEFRAHGLPRPRELKAIILKAADDLIDEYRNRPRLSEDGS